MTYNAKAIASAILRTLESDCIDLADTASAVPIASLIVDRRITHGIRAAAVAAYTIGALIERGHADTAAAVARDLETLAERV